MIAIRIQGVPGTWDLDDLVAALREQCDEADGAAAQDLQLRGRLHAAPNPNLDSKVAVVQFVSGMPSFLRRVAEDILGQTTLQRELADGVVLSFDKRFAGMTPLHAPPRDEDISIDIVAVTGLDGSPYASWASRKADLIWLRDFLGQDLPRSRVLTFGYQTRLAVDKNYRLEDFCVEFLQSLELARASETASSRPLVLLGHSYGSRIITQSLVRCKVAKNRDLAAILDCLQVVIFFGAVHKGMQTDDLQHYLEAKVPDTSLRLKIVQELRADNPAAARELRNFVDLLPGFLVISVYEMSPSRLLVRVADQAGQPAKDVSKTPGVAPRTRVWDRVGDPYTPVAVESSVLGLPASLEVTIPRDSDHSSVARFDRRDDEAYLQILSKLKDVERATGLATSYHQLLRIHQSEQRASQASGTTPVESMYNQRIVRVDPKQGLVRDLSKRPEDAAVFSTSTLITVAQSLCDRLRSVVRLPAKDFQLLNHVATVMTATRLRVALLDRGSPSANVGEAKPREIRATLLQCRQVLVDLINALDPMNTPLQHQPSSLVELDETSLPDSAYQSIRHSIEVLESYNDRLGVLASASSAESYTRLPSAATTPGVDTLARMSSTQNQYARVPEEGVEWVPFSSLKFAVGEVPETERDSPGWMERVVRFFTEEERSELRLRPRRFGVLEHHGRLERVMVEFRQYPQDTSSWEYKERRWAVGRLGRVLLASTRRDRTADAPFPCVPLRCLADLADSSTPCFALVYSVDGIVGLDEAMRAPAPPPSTQRRASLALAYAQALAALHLAELVHGGVNTENLYLRVPSTGEGGATGLEDAQALLAGFEITRPFGAETDKIDVDSPDLRVYLHHKRLEGGPAKARQRPAFDVFGLGMVIIEIGLWRRFRDLPGYPSRYAEHSDDDRRRFCKSQQKQFHGETTAQDLGGLYQSIIAFCLGKVGDPLKGRDGVVVAAGDGAYAAVDKSLRVVELLQECVRRVTKL